MTLNRAFWFGVVGFINTGVYYSCYLLLHIVVPYLLAHVLATLVAMTCSYFLNCRITFKTRPRWRTFLLFPLSNLANFVITTVGMRVAVEWAGADERWAPLPVSLVAIPITYVVTHHVMVGRLSAPYKESQQHLYEQELQTSDRHAVKHRTTPQDQIGW